MSSDHVYRAFSPSHMVRRAAGVAPSSNMEAPFDTVCALCGAHISAGDPCMPRGSTTVDGVGFHDRPAMADRNAPYLCEDCPPLMGVAFLQPSVLVTGGVIYKLSADKEIASFLLSPPANEPFIVTFANAKQQHLFWRAPVNLSPKRFSIQFGVGTLDIRHGLLMDAVISQRLLLGVYAEAISVGKKKVRSDCRSAVSCPDRKLKGGGEYAILQKIVKHAGDTPEFISFVSAFERLNHGEKWALSIIGYSELDTPMPLVPVSMVEKPKKAANK